MIQWERTDPAVARALRESYGGSFRWTWFIQSADGAVVYKDGRRLALPLAGVSAVYSGLKRPVDESAKVLLEDPRYRMNKEDVRLHQALVELLGQEG